MRFLAVYFQSSASRSRLLTLSIPYRCTHTSVASRETRQRRRESSVGDKGNNSEGGLPGSTRIDVEWQNRTLSGDSAGF